MPPEEPEVTVRVPDASPGIALAWTKVQRSRDAARACLLGLRGIEVLDQIGIDLEERDACSEAGHSS